jgi:SAM-dependent methyltransferase
LHFALDLPAEPTLHRITRFGGWCLSADGIPTSEVRVLMNGEPSFRLTGSPRPDVAAAFPMYPFARNGGFVGDVVLPQESGLNDEISISIEVRFADGTSTTAYSRTFSVAQAFHPWLPRNRSYDLKSLLQDPYARTSCPTGGKAPCCEYRWQEIAGALHFCSKSRLPTVRLIETGVTHPWGDKARELIRAVEPDQVFLDFGAGIKRPDELAVNAVFLDAIQFPNIDVVTASDRLPFKDETFSLVVSQAVFEHLPNPFRAAKEVLRVLKPGGSILIDTAFMTPFHADPDHYFNMTSEGLRAIMNGYEIIEIGVQPYQAASIGLILQLETVLPLMKEGRWRRRLEILLDEIRREGHELDDDIGPLGQRTIAAGVFVVARKPGR